MESNTLPRSEDSVLRQKIREYAKRHRQEIRTSATDALRFGLGCIKKEISELENLTVKDVKGMASRIKRRKHATTEDMYRLSHAFLQCNENIKAFAEIQGATQVLVKELTGTNTTRKIDAAECFCNYTLGDAHVCEKIATMAGSYLVTYMDSKEARLKRSCLWTLANLLATSKKSASTLLQMQLVPKLWKLYTAPADDLHGFHEDAGLCLYLIANKNLFTAEDCHFIAEHMHDKSPADPAAYYYMYIIWKSDIIQLEKELCEKNVEHLLNFFGTCVQGSFESSTDKLNAIYSVRVLSNLFVTSPVSVQPQLLQSHNQFVAGLNKLFAFRDVYFTLDLLRLVKNCINFKLLAESEVLDQLRVFKHGPHVRIYKG